MVANIYQFVAIDYGIRLFCEVVAPGMMFIAQINLNFSMPFSPALTIPTILSAIMNRMYDIAYIL